MSYKRLHITTAIGLKIVYMIYTARINMNYMYTNKPQSLLEVSGCSQRHTEVVSLCDRLLHVTLQRCFTKRLCPRHQTQLLHSEQRTCYNHAWSTRKNQNRLIIQTKILLKKPCHVFQDNTYSQGGDLVGKTMSDDHHLPV